MRRPLMPPPRRPQTPKGGLVLKALLMVGGTLGMTYGSIQDNVYIVMGALAVALVGTFLPPQGW